jgi:inhibitor of cysteine peptidase
MNRLRLFSIAALAAVLALTVAACGGSSDSTPATQTVTETQTQTETQQNTDQGQTTSSNGDTVYTEENTDVNVATGDSFTIQLPINPSTGYTWVPNIPMGYVQVSDTILESEDQGNIVGQGTAEQWVFSADTPGTGSITFDLMPPGQGVEAERTVTFIVHAN